MTSENILDIKDLSVTYYTSKGDLRAVKEVDLAIKKGEIIGIVGESGSGKSTLAYAIIKLLPVNSKIYGSIFFNGENILDKNERDLRKMRGKDISMVFQDPMSSLNPLYRVREQFTTVLNTHRGLDKKTGTRNAMELLKMVEIPDQRAVLDSFPFELSGGMQQRVMIALALSSGPQLIIADEPTTSVDATIQSQILRLLKKINREKQLSIMLITHNMGIVAELCETVVIMYAGTIMEKGSVGKVFENSQHPYTVSLLKSVPIIGEVNRDAELPTIKGRPVDLLNPPKGCPFVPRCEKAEDLCLQNVPKLVKTEEGHYVACHLVEGV